MAVDYLSALNKNGSGLNISQLVESLAAAETEPKKALVQKKVDATTVAISEMATLKSTLETLSYDLDAPSAGFSYSASSTDSAVSIEVTDPFQANSFSSTIVVSSIAKAQVLKFSSFDGTPFTSATDTLASSSDTLTIEFGTWSYDTAGATFSANSDIDSETITIAADATLTDLADALNEIDGVTAYVIETTSGLFSLLIKAADGTERALNITSSEGSLSNFATIDDDADGSLDSEIVSATDAVLSIDGLSITRSTNSISDLLPGVTLKLTDVTSSASITVSENGDTALAEMKAFVELINANRTYLNTITKRGINGAPSGPLAGDIAVNKIKSYLRDLTIAPIVGFQEDDIYLSDLGVLTELDGNLSLDEDTFTSSFNNNPNIYRAVFQSQTWSGSTSFTATETSYADLSAGVYDLEYTSSDGALTIDGVEFTLSSTSNGYASYYDSSGVFSGLKMKCPTSISDVSSSLYVGKSMIENVRSYLTELLSSSGSIKEIEFSLNEDNDAYAEQILDLDDKATQITGRYRTQFAAMETMVTKFKNTGDYLTGMIDSWNNKN